MCRRIEFVVPIMFPRAVVKCRAPIHNVHIKQKLFTRCSQKRTLTLSLTLTLPPSADVGLKGKCADTKFQPFFFFSILCSLTNKKATNSHLNCSPVYPDFLFLLSIFGQNVCKRRVKMYKDKNSWLNARHSSDLLPSFSLFLSFFFLQSGTRKGTISFRHTRPSSNPIRNTQTTYTHTPSYLYIWFRFLFCLCVRVCVYIRVFFGFLSVHLLVLRMYNIHIYVYIHSQSILLAAKT